MYPDVHTPELFTCDYILYDAETGMFSFENEPAVSSIEELNNYNLQECTAEEMLAAIEALSAVCALPETEFDMPTPYACIRLPIQHSDEIDYIFKCDFEKGAFYVARDNKVLFASKPFDVAYFEDNNLKRYVVRKEVHFNAPNPADLYDENGRLKPGWNKYLILK